MAGIGISGRLVDRHLRAAMLTSLLASAAVAAWLVGLAHQTAAVYAGVAAWGLSFGGAATLLQTALADAAGDGADVALSMNVVAWNSAIAGGGVLGGVLLNTWGAQTFPWALIALLVLALLITHSAREQGFPSTPRLVPSVT